VRTTTGANRRDSDRRVSHRRRRGSILAPGVTANGDPAVIAEVKVAASAGGGFEVQRLTEGSTSSFSARVVGLSRDGADECLAALEASPAFEAATTAVDRLRTD